MNFKVLPKYWTKEKENIILLCSKKQEKADFISQVNEKFTKI